MTISKRTPKKNEVLFKGQRKSRKNKAKTKQMNITVNKESTKQEFPYHA